MNYLRRHLGAFLRRPPAEQSWILTLSETYSAVYGEALEHGVVLRFQDRNAELFGELRLDDAERKSWLAQIDSAPDGGSK